MPTVLMVGMDRLALIPEYLNLGSVVIVAPDRDTLESWDDERSPASTPRDPPDSTDPVIIDIAGRRIVHEGASLPLSEREFLILGALLARPGDAWSFRELRQVAWQHPEELPVDPYAVKAAIQRLRAKLDVAGAPVRIEAVRGYGFRAVPGVSNPEPNLRVGSEDLLARSG